LSGRSWVCTYLIPLEKPPSGSRTNCCIGSLCCDNAEEAKSLIPSLQNKISDLDLQELLDELTKLRNFVE
jgi:RNA polymerase Rpb4